MEEALQAAEVILEDLMVAVHLYSWSWAVVRTDCWEISIAGVLLE